MKATLKNLVTGDLIKVESTKNHPDSSYGQEVWVTDDGQSIGIVNFPLVGYEIVNQG